MKDFNNKVVVVTGAGSGMGRAYAEAFAKRGAKLALNDYNANTLAETVGLLGGAKVVSQAFDVSDASAMNDFASKVEAELGAADVVINNAGVEGAVKPGWEINRAEFERIFGINFYGVVNGSQAFMPQLMSKSEAVLLNVSSIFGLIGTPNNADYCATKFAVRGYTESLMAELQESPVKAFLLHPGGIATNIGASQDDQDFRDEYLTTPPEEIVEYVIKCMANGKQRMVYGNGAYKTWLGARFVPLRWMAKIIWRELKPVSDLSLYSFLTQKR